MNSKEKDEYVNQTMERMTSMEPYYCNPFDNPKELKQRASDLLKQLNSLGDNAQEEKESIMRQLFGTYNKLAFPGDGFKCDYGFNIHTAAHEYIHSEYRIITVKVMYLRRVTHRLEYGIRCVFREEDIGLWQ